MIIRKPKTKYDDHRSNTCRRLSPQYAQQNPAPHSQPMSKEEKAKLFAKIGVSEKKIPSGENRFPVSH